MDSAAIASGVLAATKGFMRITVGEATLNTISDPGAILALSGVNLVLNNFSVASDVTITNAGNIVTGTGDNFILKQGASVSLVHNGNGKFVLTGGAGSAAGGLTTSPLATTLSPAVKNTHYLTNTSSAAFSVTLPAGAAGSVIRFSDANETWSTNALTIIPATGEKIDNLGINETLVCDVRRGWVELSWNTVLGSWSFQSLSTTTFDLAKTDGTAGLYKPGLAPGYVGGAAIPAGYVGELAGTLRSGTNGFTYSDSSSTVVGSTTTTVLTRNLDKGIYLISFITRQANASSTATLYRVHLTVGGTAVVGNLGGDSAFQTSQAQTGATHSTVSGTVPIVISANSTAVALQAIQPGQTTAGTNNHEWFIIRIG